MDDFAKDTNVPTNDCISRQEAIDAIADYLSNTTYTSAISFLNTAALILARVPIAEPKRGEWEVINEKEEVYSCSECGFVAWGKAEISNYCPNCGARMEEDND